MALGKSWTLEMLSHRLSLKILKLLHLFQAERRLAARRQARYEARNIRMKELEKKQKEEDENKANQNNIYPGKNKIFNLKLISRGGATKGDKILLRFMQVM